MLSPSGALIAMSGGVDSSVAALIAVEQGLDCAGGMMRLFSNEDIDANNANNADSADYVDDDDYANDANDATGDSINGACCSQPGARDAQAVAEMLGIPFLVFDFADAFTSRVISRFIQAYQNGETPNPCVDCNRYLKFGLFFDRAKEMGKEYIVTGHYARIGHDSGSGRYILKKGADRSKDQSYVLYSMRQEQLKHTLFPLGGLTKSQVREIAHERGFANAGKHDSQDICFVQNGNYVDFIRRYTGWESPKGRFVDVSGNDLGENKGIIHYTVGQRRGLGLSASSPLYVCSICAKDNTVVVGTQDNLYTKTLIAKDINLIPVDRFETPVKVGARIRYKQPEQAATVWQLDSDTLRVEFEKPQRAITKGQSVVLYDGDTVVGGGTIS